jgi:hypothetical protein
MFASSSRRVTTTSLPIPVRDDDASASSVSRMDRSAPEHHPAGSPLTMSATGLAGRRQAGLAAAGQRVRTGGVGR